MVKNSLFIFGVLLLALCGCLPAMKYAGSEYPHSQEGYDRLRRDFETRVLAGISPTDKSFDARTLVVLPSQVLIDAESRIRIPPVWSAVKKGDILAFEDLPTSFHFTSSRTTRDSMKPKPGSSIDDMMIDRWVLRLNEARERDFQITIEALRLRKIFKEISVTRSDSSESLSLPKCEVTICFDADITKRGTIKVGESSPESIFEEKPVEEMPSIRKRSGAASTTDPDKWFDLAEAKQRTALLDWLDQLEKAAGKHLKK